MTSNYQSKALIRTYGECNVANTRIKVPLYLNTIKADKRWKTKIDRIVKEESSSIQFDSKDWDQTLECNIISRVMHEIWLPQAIARFQRRFRNWTYTPGNPGFQRRLHAIDVKEYYETTSICCGLYRKKKASFNPDWSD